LQAFKELDDDQAAKEKLAQQQAAREAAEQLENEQLVMAVEKAEVLYLRMPSTSVFLLKGL